MYRLLLVSILLLISGITFSGCGWAATYVVIAGHNQSGKTGFATGENKNATIKAANADCKSRAGSKCEYHYWTLKKNHLVMYHCKSPFGSGTDSVQRAVEAMHSKTSLADARAKLDGAITRAAKRFGFSLKDLACVEVASYSKGRHRRK